MRVRNGKTMKYRDTPCPKCHGKNMMTKGADACWECTYSKFKGKKRYCTKCDKRLTKRNWPKTAMVRHHNICKTCFNEMANEKYQERRAWYKAKNQSYKEAVMAFYGGKCACCGITDLVFLNLDHIDNNGASHRRSMGTAKNGNRGTGASIYKWIVDNEFPDGFQVLCWNCNWAKSHGGCPHQGIVVEEKPRPKVKVYTCNKCGKVFDHHGKFANHIRYDHSQVGETHSKRVKVGKASGVKA